MKHLSTKWIYILALSVFSTQLLGQVVINEYSVSNLDSFIDNFNHHEDWFELYNSGSSSLDLGGYYLSDDQDEPDKWQFPDGSEIQPNGFIRVWATGRDLVVGDHYHVNFRLSQTKDTPESIVLSDMNLNQLDAVQLQLTQKEHARGRKPDGSENWVIFTNPTPKATNNNANAYTHYAEKPVMSDSAGFYTSSLNIAMSTTEPNAVIRYTTDGSKPTSSSQQYSGAVPVSETTIINAGTFSSNSDVLPSFITFHTYFINESHNMGVMSCSAEQLDNLLNGNQSLRPFGTFEYFNEDGVRTTFGYGEFNEHGQDSWVHDQRSIDYISRDECGYNYAIREKLIPITDRDEYQRIILRAAGDDNYPGIDTSALLRDFFVQNTAELGDMHLDVRKGQKGVLYVNGIYWGVYGFREKVNDHDFTDYYYDQGKYDIYYLMLWGGSWAEYGGQAAWNDWNDLHDFIKYNDMADQDNYDYVKTRLDYESLVDYILINSFVVCSDWINWNVGWWRGTNPDGGHQKWGYVLWDEDATFNHYINYTGVPGTQPTVSPCYPEGLTADPEQHILMLNHLLDNDEFYTYYVSRYVDLYNTVFRPERMINYLDSIEARMLPEMPQHVARWGGTVAQWQNNVQKIRNFITARHNFLPAGLSSCYNLDGPYELNVMIDPPVAGLVKLNSIVVDESSFGGYYFGGVETRFEAVETNPAYTFDHWEAFNHEFNPDDTSKVVTLNLETGEFVKAVFQLKEFADSLVINEINYNPADNFDCGDWVEFYNPMDISIDVSGWQFKDEDDDHIFEFPEGTLVDSQGYLVIVRDSADFTTFFPDVENFMGEMDFGLSSNGELIRLFNADGVLVDTVHFDEEEPWPTAPNGTGPTLELIQWDLDNALPGSWVASENNGTPGSVNSIVISGINPQKNAKPLAFVIYPNPVKNNSVFRVTSGHGLHDASLIITDIFGNVVMKFENIVSDHFTISKSNLSPGVYACRLYDPVLNTTITRKMIVE
ncbi:MAG: CotH kinase family protein [Bacteroidales bacterium]|nr:CotH kinase family protein [Bacteroidales bacterium]